MTLGQLTRAAQPPEQSAVVAGRLGHFTRQYMTEVGLDVWLQTSGGLEALLTGTVSHATQCIIIHMSCSLYQGDVGDTEPMVEIAPPD